MRKKVKALKHHAKLAAKRGGLLGGNFQRVFALYFLINKFAVYIKFAFGYPLKVVKATQHCAFP